MTILALSDTAATIGLVGVFFVLFPLLLHGLIGFAAAQALGERADNQQFAAGLDEDGERV